MQFIKNNSYNIGRHIITQVGLLIFANVLSVAASTFSKVQGAAYASENAFNPLLLGVSIFSVLFYMFLLYTMMWEQGAKDIIRIEAGRMKKDKLLGAKISFFANIPNLILWGLMLIGFVFGFTALASFEWAQGLFGVVHIIAGLLESMFTGIIKVFLTGTLATDALICVFAYLLAILPSMLACFLGYLSGMKNFRLFSFKKPQKPQKPQNP